MSLKKSSHIIFTAIFIAFLAISCEKNSDMMEPNNAASAAEGTFSVNDDQHDDNVKTNEDQNIDVVQSVTDNNSDDGDGIKDDGSDGDDESNNIN